MKKLLHPFVSYFLLAFFFLSCYSVNAQDVTAIKVELKKLDGSFKLFRGGQPYFIKGAGGTNYMERLAQYGGNSIRTWDSRNGEDVLNKANGFGPHSYNGFECCKRKAWLQL